MSDEQGYRAGCGRCKALEDALVDMVLQFAYDSDGTPPTIHTGGLSALEGAFAALGCGV